MCIRDRWCCVTKGNILLRASLFFCLSEAFPSLNFIPERCFDPANNGQTGYINSTSLQKILLPLWEFPVATDEIPGRIETTVLPQNLHFNHGRNPHCWRFMETGDISNKEAEAFLFDEKIVTRKHSKADSVAWKSNVNSDENVNQLAEVLKNQDARGRQIARKTSKLSSLRLKFQKKNLHSWTRKCTKLQDSTRIYPWNANILQTYREFSIHELVLDRNTSLEKKMDNTIHQRTAGVA